jgi:hypothetical protein
MAPQIDQRLSLDQTEKIEKSLRDYNSNVFNIQEHLLILLYIQWVSPRDFSKVTFYKN